MRIVRAWDLSMSLVELNPEHQKLWQLEKRAIALTLVVATIPICLYFLGYLEKEAAIRFALIPVIPMGSLRMFIAVKCAEVWHAGKLIRLEERPRLFFLIVLMFGLTVICSLILGLTIELWVH